MRWLAIVLIGALFAQAAAPAPVAAQAPRRDPVLAASPFTFVPQVQRAPVRYETVKDRVVFRARLAGRDVWALLDNGADRTLIDLGTARAAGLELATGTGRVFGAGGGSLTSQWVADVPVAIAGQFEARMPMLGLDMSAASKILGYKIELVLGADALMHLALMVDPFERTFHLTPSGQMAIDPGSAAIAMRGKRALIEVRIGDRPATVSIDLGSNGGLALTQAAWERMGATGRHLGIAKAMGATGEPYEVEVIEVEEIGIGALRVQKVNTSLEPARPGTGDGIVGMAVLGQFVIVMDLGLGKLWLMAPESAEKGRSRPALHQS